jgi:hypothetical protein
MLLAAPACATDTGSQQQETSTCDATAVFAESVCVCGDFTDVGNLVVGKSREQDQASLVVMGATKAINNFQVRGDFKPHGGLEARGNLEVTGNLQSAGTVDDIGNIEIGGSLHAGGDLKGIGRLSVAEDLGVGGENSFIGYMEAGRQVAYEPVAEPACGCAEDQILDVAGAVAAAKAANDNAAHGVPTSVRNLGATALKLTAGSYYLTDLEAIGATGLSIDGAVSLYLDGDLVHVGAAWVHLEPGASLDMYVSGSVSTIGHVDLGNKWEPSQFRLYIGGSGEASLNVGNQIFNGAIYAPRADITYVGNTQIRGALTVHEIHGVGNLEIGYAAPSCPSTEPTDPQPVPEGEPPVVL